MKSTDPEFKDLETKEKIAILDRENEEEYQEVIGGVKDFYKKYPQVSELMEKGA
jgi:hypothetical protein